MKAYLKAWDEVNAAHNALMTHLLEAGSDKECQEANRRLDAAIAKAQELRHNSSSSTLRARLTASVH